MSDNNNLLQIKNVTKKFILSNKQMKINHTNNKEKIAVKNLSLNIKKGSIYGLLGSNGAGKTTTLRMISTLIKPNSGEILYEGISIFKDELNYKKKIAFLTSDLKLDPFFTPSYLFDYYANLRNIPQNLIELRKKQLFDYFEINDFSEIKIKELSTGMSQKVSLAISLLHDPEFIIFDEPTNGLDILTAKTVIDYILKLKNEGKTIILSSHIFSLIEKTCDEIGIIVDGQMILEGNLKELTEDISLEDLFFNLYQKEHKE